MSGKKGFYLPPFDLRDWRWAAGAATKRSTSARLLYKSVTCHPPLLLPAVDAAEGHAHRWVDEQAAIALLPRCGELCTHVLGMSTVNTDVIRRQYAAWFDAVVQPKVNVVEEGGIAAATLSQRMEVLRLGDQDWSKWAIDLPFLCKHDVYVIMVEVQKHSKAAARPGKATILNPLGKGLYPMRLEVVVMLQESKDTDVDRGLCANCGQGGHSTAQCKQPGLCFARCFGLLAEGKRPTSWPKGSASTEVAVPRKAGSRLPTPKRLAFNTRACAPAAMIRRLGIPLKTAKLVPPTIRAAVVRARNVTPIQVASPNATSRSVSHAPCVSSATLLDSPSCSV